MATRSLASRLDNGSSNKNNLRIANDGAAHGHALTLAAGELAWIAVQQTRKTQNFGRARDPFLNFPPLRRREA